MRLDHVAYRVADRRKTADFLINALGYRLQQEFPIDFGDGDLAQCIALEPPEKLAGGALDWVLNLNFSENRRQEYHCPPEIFVSDGTPNSVVGQWVEKRGGIGGIHHIAYQVKNVSETMKEWLEKRFVEFTSEQPMRCPEDNLIQIFTKPIEVMGGIIIEFIERGEFGFCQGNVKSLMESTKGL